MKNKLQKGFTLIEVMIALSILASVMTILSSSVQGNFRRVKKAEVVTQAAHLLQKKLIEIEILYKDDISKLPEDLQKGKFKDKSLSKYSWEWKSAEFHMPDIASLFIQQDGTADETSVKVIKQMKKYFEDSIKEIKVTLIYKSSTKAKAQKFSIATILVDYDVPLNLSLGGAPGQ